MTNAASEVTTWLEDGIINVRLSHNAHVTKDLLHKAFEEHQRLAPEGKMPVLFHGNSAVKADHEAHRFASSPEVEQQVSAGAILVKAFLARHLAKLFLLYHKPNFPVQIFANESEAKAWLMTQHGKQAT